MPTVNDDDDNASTSDASEEAQQEDSDTTDDVVTEEQITSHPKYIELQEKHAAARKGMDGSNMSKKKLEAENARLRVLADETEEEESAEPDPKDEMIALKEEIRWELKNDGRIELVKEEFEKIVEEGYDGEKVSKKVALELAEKQAKVDSSGTQRARQDDMSTASTTTRNEDVKGYTSEDTKSIGLTAKRERELERKHPHLNAA